MITSAPVREGSSETSGTLWWLLLARGQAPCSLAGSWLICQSEEERGELNPGVKLTGASCGKALGQGETGSALAVRSSPLWLSEGGGQMAVLLRVFWGQVEGVGPAPGAGGRGEAFWAELRARVWQGGAQLESARTGQGGGPWWGAGAQKSADCQEGCCPRAPASLWPLLHIAWPREAPSRRQNSCPGTLRSPSPRARAQSGWSLENGFDFKRCGSL